MSDELLSLYLLDIEKEIGDISYFIEALDLTKFLGDVKTQKAVIMSLLNIGELVKKLPSEFKSSNPQIEWYKLAGLRNRIAHDYPGLDFELIWNIINNEVPAFGKDLALVISKK
jgi:uncharacterized protein with HEPN domain